MLYELNATEFHFLYVSCVDFKIETFLSSFISFTLFHLFHFLPLFSLVVNVYLFCCYDRLTQLAEYLLKRHMLDTYIRIVISIKLYNYIMFKYIYSIYIYIVSYMYMLVYVYKFTLDFKLLFKGGRSFTFNFFAFISFLRI